MLSDVKPLVMLLSAIVEISLDSWKFCTCILTEKKSKKSDTYCISAYMRIKRGVIDDIMTLEKREIVVLFEEKSWTSIKQCWNLPIE